MANECYYSNCSVILPRMLYTGGDLATAIILTALLVAGISVAIHIAVFYWIYKKKRLPRKTLSSRRVPAESSRNVLGERSGDDLGQMTYECVDDENSEDTSARAPKIKKNEAYGKVKVMMGQD